MKHTRFIAAALSVMLLIQTSAFSQDDKDKRDKIIGSGKVITKEVPVKSFNDIKVSGVFHVILSQGSKEEVKIEADDNLQSLFEVSNDGDQLVIKMKDNQNFDSDHKLKVYISFNKLKKLSIRTVGSVSSTESLNFDDISIESKGVGPVDLKMTAQKANIENTGVGTMKLQGKADIAIIKNTGVGSIQAGDFVVQTMDITNTGVGHSEVNAEKEIKVKDSFLGKVKNKGAAAVKKMNKAA